MKKSFRHVFNCTQDRYWRELFFDKRYNFELYKHLGFVSRSIIEETITETSGRQYVKANLGNRSVPGILKFILPSSFCYFELNVVDFENRTARFQIAPAEGKLGISIDCYSIPCIGGSVSFERVCNVHVSSEYGTILGGRIVEEFIMSNLGKDYEKARKFTNRYLETH